MGWDNRSLIIFILLAILISSPISFWIGRWEGIKEMEKRVIPLYQREIDWLKMWNEELKKALLPMSPFIQQKKGSN